jgi:hypothetical protein
MAGKTEKPKHVHKLKRLVYKTGNAIFFCTMPDCNFKINIKLALGKRSICWLCGNEFIMTDYSLRLAKPHCEDCHKPKHPVHIEPTSDLKEIENAEALREKHMRGPLPSIFSITGQKPKKEEEDDTEI